MAGTRTGTKPQVLASKPARKKAQEPPPAAKGRRCTSCGRFLATASSGTQCEACLAREASNGTQVTAFGEVPAVAARPAATPRAKAPARASAPAPAPAQAPAPTPSWPPRSTSKPVVDADARASDAAPRVRLEPGIVIPRPSQLHPAGTDAGPTDAPAKPPTAPRAASPAGAAESTTSTPTAPPPPIVESAPVAPPVRPIADAPPDQIAVKPAIALGEPPAPVVAPAGLRRSMQATPIIELPPVPAAQMVSGASDERNGIDWWRWFQVAMGIAVGIAVGIGIPYLLTR